MSISIKCGGCGQGYRVSDESVGRSTKCRKCGTVIPIAAHAAIAPIALQPLAPPPVVRDQARERDWEDDSKPRFKSKKKKSNRALVFVLAGLAVAILGFVVLAAGGAAVYFFMAGGGDDGMKYMPNNPQVLASLRIHALSDSDLATQIKKEIPPGQGNADWTRASSEFRDAGINPDDIDRVLVGANVSSQDATVVVTFRTAIDIQKIVQAVEKKNNNKKLKEIKVGKHTIYEEEGASSFAMQGVPGMHLGQGQKAALCSPESKILVVGSATTLQAVLQRDKKPEFADGMKAVMKYADLKSSICIAADVKALKASAGSMVGNRPMMGFENVEGAALNIWVKSDLNVDATLLCIDAAAADSLKKQVEGAIALAKPYLAQQMGGQSGGGLDGLKFTTSGNAVFITVNAKGSDIIDGMRKARNAMPPMGMQPQFAPQPVRPGMQPQPGIQPGQPQPQPGFPPQPGNPQPGFPQQPGTQPPGFPQQPGTQPGNPQPGFPQQPGTQPGNRPPGFPP